MLGFAFAGCSDRDVAAEAKAAEAKEPEIKETESQMMEMEGTIHTSEPEDRALAEKLVGEVLDALERQDVSKLEEMFSEYAKKNAEDLEKELEDLIQAYPGADGSYEGNCSTHEENNRGKKLYVLNSAVDVKKGGTYCSVNICYVRECADDPSMEGIHLIQLLRDPDHAPEGFYWHDQEDEPGAYVEN